MRRPLWILIVCCISLALASCSKPGWRPDHSVIVILENRSARQVEASPEAPYLNALARSGAYMVRAYFAQSPYGVVPKGANAPLPARPSQPNYLYLFSANDQGVSAGIGNDTIPVTLRPFTTPNLGAAIIGVGATFASFCESLPYPHYDGAYDPGGDAVKPDRYRRKHNPAVNWIEMVGTQHAHGGIRFLLRASANLGFVNTHDPVDGGDYRGFALDAGGDPIGYDQLPTVSLIVPNEQHDAHSNSLSAADAWLRMNIGPYADWARTHNSLLVVTFDEDGSTDTSHGDPDQTGQDTIFTVFYGPPDKVIAGRYAERIDHLNVLATLLDRYQALQRFKFDFLLAFVFSAEGRAEYANLVPIKDIFGEGAPLAGR